ncbi:hypothetical protein FPV67DRAFT_209321 [Lyophyllum atratum]|nr:hypothetical protein FPV67DRAFT_209321 [Lyophyllum atratum]
MTSLSKLHVSVHLSLIWPPTTVGTALRTSLTTTISRTWIASNTTLIVRRKSLGKFKIISLACVSEACYVGTPETTNF